MIQLENLTRRFGELTAVDALTVDMQPGRITALLGPNGAGKTTTLNMVTTLLPPSDGRAAVCGFDVFTQGQDVRRSIGYVPEHGAVYEGLTGREYLELAATLRELPPAATVERGLGLFARFGIADAADQRLGSYSKGMRRKAVVAAALVHQPPVLFLDEPMDGLDVKSQNVLGDLLRELAAGGCTVVYSSHILQQVEELCDDVVLLHQGRLRYQGPLTELRAGHGGSGLRDIFLELTEDEE